METAARVLIAGGVLNLGYGALTGLIISSVRRRSPEANRFLVLAHLGPLMQGPMLLGLAVATGLSSLSGGVETFAAWLLVAGSAGIAAGDTLHWLGGVGDAFAERPPGFYLQSVGGIVTAVGLLIVIVGVFRGLQ
jgi:hypothetical protein